MADFKRAY